MDANELAGKMLEWGQKHLELALLTAEIETAVLEIGKTQNVGNVRASYSKGKKRYDYGAAGCNVNPEIAANYTVFPKPPDPYVDWRELCKGEGIKDIPFTQGEPSVKVKVVA